MEKWINAAKPENGAVFRAEKTAKKKGKGGEKKGTDPFMRFAAASCSHIFSYFPEKIKGKGAGRSGWKKEKGKKWGGFRAEDGKKAVFHIIHKRVFPPVWKTEIGVPGRFSRKQIQYMPLFSPVCPGFIHNLQIFIDERENNML
ncbi:MAG: hypothetical protein J5472_02560 [Clostridia bacterium]|nr:hypothetical protein [Clostridia bacterium]